MKAIVNVRLGSSRLPGKVLKTFWNGQTVLEVLVERLSAASLVDEIIVNTTMNSEDDALIEFCLANNLKYNRGDESDVLGRMCDCIRRFELQNFVEVFGDCPLVDPKVVDRFIKVFQREKLDFVGNDLRTTYPPGFEVEVVNSTALLSSEKLCSDPLIREHGTLFVRQNPKKYKIINLEYEKHIEALPHLTLDTMEDFNVINNLHKILTQKYGKSFSLEDILELAKANPAIFEGNKQIERRWKQYRDD